MDERIAWALTEIDRRLGEPIDIARLAAGANLSPSRFAHLFRRVTGVAPLRYIRTRRMERARVLLERTFLTVKEVMAAVGCNDPSHFARDFRRYHGVPPRQWRAAMGSSRQEPPDFQDSAADEGSAVDAEQKSPTVSRRRQRTRGP